MSLIQFRYILSASYWARYLVSFLRPFPIDVRDPHVQRRHSKSRTRSLRDSLAIVLGQTDARIFRFFTSTNDFPHNDPRVPVARPKRHPKFMLHKDSNSPSFAHRRREAVARDLQVKQINEDRVNQARPRLGGQLRQDHDTQAAQYPPSLPLLQLEEEQWRQGPHGVFVRFYTWRCHQHQVTQRHQQEEAMSTSNHSTRRTTRDLQRGP